MDNSATFIIGNRNKRAIQVPPVKQSKYFKRNRKEMCHLGNIGILESDLSFTRGNPLRCS